MLVERDGLLRTLADLHAAVAGGGGSTVFVAGEAGAGKTTLVRAFADSLDRSTLVVAGACDPLTTPRPLSPLHDFAADADAGLGDLHPGDRDPVEVFSDVLDRLTRTIRPIVMIIEDVHWADEATLDLLRFLGRRIGDAPSMLLCTYRDDELGPSHPLRPVLGQLIPLDSTHRLVVPPLSVEAVGLLADDPAVDAGELHRRTGGNAFFVTEVLAADAPVPGSVQDAVLARVAGLSDSSRRVVEVVSIAPRQLEIDRAMSLTGAIPDAVDGAVGSGILLSDGRSLRFRHELARAAVEDALPPARRLDLHRRFISLLEEDDPRDIARLAHHAARTGDAALIATYAPEAGDDALARGARRQAISFWRSALDHPGGLEPATEADLLLSLGRELRFVQEDVEARRALERAAELYREMGDMRSVGRTLVLLQTPVWRTAGKDAGLAKTAEALEILEALGPTEELALAHYRVAHNHMVDRRRESAREAVAAARDVARAVGSDEMLWRADMIGGCIEIVMGDAALGVEMLEGSLADAETLGAFDLVNVALGMLGSGGGEARRYEEAIPALERGVEHAVATDDDGNAAYNRSWLARIAFEQGRWDEAGILAESALRSVADRTDIAGLTALCALGRVRVRRGDPGGDQALDEVLGVADGELLQYVWNAYCGRAEHAWLRGEPRSAESLVAHAFERAMETDSPWARGEVGFWAWRLGLVGGPPDGVAEPFALQMTGDWRGAADRWRTIGCPYEEAMALADGDVDSMVESIGILDRLGAAPASRLVRSRLREAGVEGVPRGPTRATLANPANLTARQLEVLELMVRGLSNAEIADRLYVSKKTVEHHVSAVYAKLEVPSRPKAIAAAIDRGIVEI